jgi:predicted alpha-1,2-mannosidase
LEYSYQDWCLSQLAKALNKVDDQQYFQKRSKNYQNLWNPNTGFIHPRNLSGEWISDFAPVGEGFTMPGFVEGNAAIYTNFVPHDLQGLIELFGGREKYVQFLNNSFEKAQANNFITDHGKHAESWVDYENQPSCHMAHIFNHAGAPWLTQKWVRVVKEQTFGDTTAYGGYNGDEDQGQMGALGVLMAIGLFQMDGGASVGSSYDITAPIFDTINISLNSEYYTNKTLQITTKNNSIANHYIQSATWNGVEFEGFSIPHEEMIQGGELKITLGDTPNYNWGISK